MVDPKGVAVLVDVGVAVELPVGVGVPDPVGVGDPHPVHVGVGVGVEVDVRLNESVQALAAVVAAGRVGSAANGILEGTLGATDWLRSWYSLTAVNIATPARIRVMTTIMIVPALPFI